MAEKTPSTDRYHRLIDAICAEANIPDPESLYENCSVDINEVMCTLMHADFIDPDVVLLYTDFGALPAEHRELALL